MWGSIIGAGISAIGGMMGNKSSASEAKKSNLFARENYRHQHQWEVQDLRKAGLNPILSANSGSNFGGAQMASQSNPFAGIGDTINSSRKIDEVDKEQVKVAQDNVKIAAAVADQNIKTQAANEQESTAKANLATEEAALTRNQSISEVLRRPKISAEVNALAAQAAQAQAQASAIPVQAARDQSQIRLNSAMEEHERSKRELTEREKRSGKYEEKTKTYTRPVRDVIHTITKPISDIFHGQYPSRD